jgi:hypothetical protein
MIETGKIIGLKDKKHFYLDIGKETLYIGNEFEFGNLEIGKEVSLDLIPRFQAQSFVKNINGNYKFVDIIQSKGEKKSPLIIFLNLVTNELIDVTLDNQFTNFNNYILGDFYDLNIIETYKGFDFLENIPQNKNCLNVEITILNALSASLHYIALYKEKLILISSNDNLNAYIGQTILISLYKKYITYFCQIGNNFYPSKSDIFTFNLSYGINKLISRDNNDYILTTESEITSNNIGKNILLNYYPLKYGDFNSLKISTNLKEGYKLLGLLQSGQYIFVDVNNKDNIFSCYFSQPINFDNKLGSIFSFTYSDYNLLIEIKNILKTDQNTNPDYYRLTEIIENSTIKIFSRNNVKYAVNCKKIGIADSFLGANFDLNIIPYIFGEIKDIN